MSLFDSILRLTSPLLEAGLRRMDRGLGAAGTALDRLAGEQPAGAAPPSAGAMNVDAAASELANRALRRALRTPLEPEPFLRSGAELVRRSIELLPLDDPRRLALLPLRLPISWASLATQEGLRSLAAAHTVPLSRMPEFLVFVAEIFSDLEIYFSLQYQDELARWRARVDRDPADARSRLALARTYLKCGLFEESAREARRAADAPEWQKRALYEALVAGCRAGKLESALEDGVRCLALDPGDEKARYWLFLTAQKAGGYPESVPQEARMEILDGHHESPVELEDVAGEMGLDKVSGGRGTAIFDFDGDGRLDVAVAGAHAGCSLFRNRGDGTFEDVSTGSGLDRCVYSFALAAGDYDNDGRPDLFITSLGFFNGRSKLMRNVSEDGRPRFIDVSEEAGLGDLWGPGFTATWVDYDGDGFLDLFVANNLGGLFDRKTPNRLFRNNGDGTFTEVTREAGLDTPWPTIGAAWGDFTNNGRPDLFVNGLGRAQLFRNNGTGHGGAPTFTDVSREAGIDAPANGSVALVCDIDDDGWLDIVQFTYSRPYEAIYTLRHGHGPPGGTPPRVFRNNRDGVPTFTEVGAELGLTGCWGTMSAACGDVDNDGHQDLFLGNGDPAMDRAEASILYVSDGRRFRNVSFAAGLPLWGKGHGANLADLLGDGRMHLIMAHGGLYPGDLQTTAVYAPRETPAPYLNVRLTGTRSNRDAIGARLRLRAGGRDQHRLVSGGTHFGCLPHEQHFGLGAVPRVDELEIRWPSGDIERFNDLPTNATIRVVEGRGGFTLESPRRP